MRYVDPDAPLTFKYNIYLNPNRYYEEIKRGRADFYSKIISLNEISPLSEYITFLP